MTWHAAKQSDGVHPCMDGLPASHNSGQTPAKRAPLSCVVMRGECKAQVVRRRQVEAVESLFGCVCVVTRVCCHQKAGYSNEKNV